MNFTIATRLILLLTCGIALPLRTMAAEAKDEGAKKKAAVQSVSISDAEAPSRPALTPSPSPATGEGSTSRPAAKKNAAAIAWLSSLNDGYRRALSDRKPILIRAGAKWCAQCRKLATAIETAEVQAELARWTPVYLDVDAQPDDAAELGVMGVPALRIRTPAGQHVAERDGYLAPDELVDWLKKNYEAATRAADDVLLASGEPSATAAVRLVKQFQQRNPALREAAIRRLLPYPNIARSAVLRAFANGSLTSRLAAIEVLEQWKAPLEGLDPWRPETFTPQRLARLDKWKDREVASGPAAPKKLSKKQLAAARRQIDRMLVADELEASRNVVESRAKSAKIHNPAVQQRMAGVNEDMLRRRQPYPKRRLAQRQHGIWQPNSQYPVGCSDRRRQGHAGGE